MDLYIDNCISSAKDVSGMENMIEYIQLLKIQFFIQYLGEFPMTDNITWPGWKTVRLIGEGSFGKVYEIEKEDIYLKREAALKVIVIPNDKIHAPVTMSEASKRSFYEQNVQKIVEEIRLMTQLQSQPNIVSYEDFQVNEENGVWTILIRMPLLKPFSDWLREKTPEESDIIRLGIQIGSALWRCHSMKIIHRDVKPENIFVNKGGDFLLGDFGISRTLEEQAGNLTYAGTLNYMAPEVFRRKDYGFSADVYSLALIMYELLNDGNPPYVFNSYYDPEEQENARLRRMRGDYIYAPKHGSEALHLVILRALQYDPEARYASAEEFVNALRKCELSRSAEEKYSEADRGNETVYAEDIQAPGNVTDSSQVPPHVDDAGYHSNNYHSAQEPVTHPKQGYEQAASEKKPDTKQKSEKQFGRDSINTGLSAASKPEKSTGQMNPESLKKILFTVLAVGIIGIALWIFITGDRKPDPEGGSTLLPDGTSANAESEIKEEDLSFSDAVSETSSEVAVSKESTDTTSSASSTSASPTTGDPDDSTTLAFMKPEYAGDPFTFDVDELIPSNEMLNSLNTEYLEEQGFRILDDNVNDELFAAAFRLEDKALADTVSGAILALVQDGTYASIAEKYPDLRRSYYLNASHINTSAIPKRGSGNPDFVFRHGIDTDYPPYTFLGDDGTAMGVDVELAQAVCSYMGWQYEAVPFNWDERDLCLMNKECDCIWSAYTWTQEREATYLFSVAYERQTDVCIVGKGSSIQTWNDLPGKVVGLNDLSPAFHFEEVYPDLASAIVHCADEEEGLLYLQTGKIDAFVTSLDYTK